MLSRISLALGMNFRPGVDSTQLAIISLSLSLYLAGNCELLPVIYFIMMNEVANKEIIYFN